MTDSSRKAIEYLLEIFQNDKNLSKLLEPFDQVLWNELEKKINNISEHFQPLKAEREFLTWLRGWVNLTLLADIGEQEERNFIANIISHYKRRGTKANLLALLRIFVKAEPEIRQLSAGEFIVGQARVGESTRFGGGKPHWFEVVIQLPETLKDNQMELNRQKAIARYVIELEKPAHTHYRLIVNYPGTFTVGKSELGKNSFLGTKTDNKTVQ